jgi:hypothetical protein
MLSHEILGHWPLYLLTVPILAVILTAAATRAAQNYRPKSEAAKEPADRGDHRAQDPLKTF